MESLYEPYQHLKAEQRKLLCFLAYSGQKTDQHHTALYRHCENLNANKMKELVNSLRPFYQSEYYSYSGEYELHGYHIAPLMQYMLEKMPQWLDYFDKMYKDYQKSASRAMLSRLKDCIEGKPLARESSTKVFRDADVLVPLASDDRFLPMMEGILDIRH